MEQVEHETEKAKLLFVLLPEGAENCALIQSHAYMSSPRLEHSLGGIDLPPGDWEHLGSPFEVSEEVKERIVDCNAPHQYGEYKDYRSGEYDEFLSRDESFDSLLTFLEIYGVNPYGETEPEIWDNGPRWVKAQSRTGNWQEFVLWKA